MWGSVRPDTWKAVQRARLLELLGDLPDERGPVRTLAAERRPAEGYILERLVLDLNGIEPVPAWFVRPAGAEGKLPVVLFNHSHGGNYHVGKDELIKGAAYLQTPPFAELLTGLGYAALGIDAWGFGERSVRTEAEIFKEMLWTGKVLWGMMVYDGLRAVDYLCTRPDVDPDRIGTLGMSMGGTMAWWLAALDERIRFCVDLCSLADYDTMRETRAFNHHNFYYFVPGLLKRFTTGSINALIAPRPHLSLAGLRDKLVPAAGLDKLDRELKAVYEAAGAPDNWRLFTCDAGHEETEAMRSEIRAFLTRQLEHGGKAENADR